MFERLVVLNGPNDFNRVEKQLNKDRDVVICFNYSTYKLSQTLGFKSYLGNEMYRCGAFEGSSKLVNEIVNQWHLKGNNESGIKLNNIEICKIIDYRLLLILTGYFRYYHFFHGLFEKYDFKSLIVFYRKEDESNLLDPLNWYHHLTNYIRNHKPTIKQTSFESDGMRVYSPLVGPMWGELSGKSIFVKTLISFFFRPFRNKKKNRVMFFYSSFSKTLLENLIKKTKGDVDFVIPGNNISPKQMVKMGIRSHLSVFSHLRGNLSNEKRNKLEKEIQKVVRDYSESHLPKWLRKDFDQIINEIFVSKLPQINGLAESIQQELQFFQVKLVFLKDLQTELSVLVSLVAKKLNIQTALLQHGVVTMLVPSGGSWAPSKISSKIVCFGQEYRKGAGLCRYTSSEILN